MMKRLMILLVIGLSIVGPTYGQTQIPPPGQTPLVLPDAPVVPPATAESCAPNLPVIDPTGLCKPPYCWWIGGEVLLWQVRGMHIPPLISGSAPGTPVANAGILGTEGSELLYGDTHVNSSLRFGPRITVGGWLDECGCWGVQGEFFMLETLGSGFNATSDGSQILARPFIDPTLSPAGPNAELIAYPGLLAGNVQVSASSTGLLGGGLLLSHKICCSDCYRLDALVGYRFLRLHDSLSIAENLQVSPDVIVIPAGTNIYVNDSFATTNQFHGVDLGLMGQAQWNKWIVSMRAKVAVGHNDETVDINGSTTVVSPGYPIVTNTGGLLALGSNIGHYDQGHISVIPQLDLKLGYQITPHIVATAGYTFMDWMGVVRAGDQIDLVVNPNLLPPSTPPVVGPLRPSFTYHQNDLLINGFSFGLEFRF